MPNIIQGVKVDGVTYKYDYESLENLPETLLPDINAVRDTGKVLTVNTTGDAVWRTVEALPSYSRTDDGGKVLTIDNSEGNLCWCNGVPLPDTSDYGKVLTAASGSYEWNDVLALPSFNQQNDAGKVLTVGNTDLEWETPDSALPSYSPSDDSGKVLMINNTEPVWDNVLPNYNSSHAGEYLRVDAYGDNIEWVESDIPSDGDMGDVLMVMDSYGRLGWSALDSLPTCYTGGLILSYSSGSPTWTSMEDLLNHVGGSELPHAGEVLVAGGCNQDPFTWDSIIPSYSANDAGKVLSVANDGTLEWVTPQ